MNAKSLVPFIAAITFSLSAHAHDCSGGSSGGMDATGNLCNDMASVTTVAASDHAASPAVSAPKVETSKATSANSIAKHTSVTRHASKRTRIAHG